ncbi:GNAT family N-acetyltransferase [Parvibaculum sp.]|jgi:ribosomal protein S18 acetylase RimI-like enzyme|uniref:GNAT family N-acetyltransferase n=1 Tax=Parvibaculum sp. TaxID=2024848 RepID=UPI001B200462|nr:GNAT family N-acetyltransferase [Parvibaculum sp.]MBO6633540.1 GNAT family N-acetyltransferase [Parvibaculum sp.]MBO6677700.1 GNAT family N-acetyltransferase [Parvibaculum sp.]MBO6685388.1 GNAT family N-acetyltransferase [Parvibaculum sp.]MBO6905461.1 GNAT family N-acetyltransferase [Parvibaculum sp.]
MGIEIARVEKHLAETHAERIPELVFATGPASYSYIFGGRGPLFDGFIDAAWKAPANFFSHEQAALAFEDGAFRGVLISHDGPEHYRLKDGVWPVAQGLAEDGGIGEAEIGALAERAEIASFMNPHVPEDCSYILVVSVPETARGRGAGRALIEHEIERARARSYSRVHLDVMSDNPAVGLYRAMGFEPMAETVTPIPCREHGLAMELRMMLRL